MVDNLIQALGGHALINTVIHENLKWLDKSFFKNTYAGSSAYANIFGQWSSPYPETTGYLIPTLLQVGKQLNESYWIELAQRQLDYFESIQDSEGFFLSINNKPPLVFDTAQILLGICALKKNGFLKEENKKLIKAYFWLISKLNDEGYFTENNFVKDYNPSYYSRIAWALLKTEQVFGLEPETKVIRLYNRIKNLQNINFSFINAAFGPNEPVYTHTILYTIRGLWEGASRVQDHKTLQKMKQTVKHLDELISKNNQKFAGSFDENWNGDYSFICTVGNCQLAYIKLLMYKKSGDDDFLRNIKALMQPLLNKQKLRGINAGAIPSSIPIWGPYQRFRYTNWTQKFFLDFMLELLNQENN